MLIKLFLESKKCNWIWDGRELNSFAHNEANRFDVFYNKYLDLGVDDMHPGPIHNKNYSEKLYTHIYENFRKYLPNECISITKKIL